MFSVALNAYKSNHSWQKWDKGKFVNKNLHILLFLEGDLYYTERIPFICSQNQWTGFYMVGTPRHEKVNRIFSSEAVSWRCSIKIGILENFAKLTRKHNSLEHTCTDKINLWQFSSAIKIMIQFLEITMTLEREASLNMFYQKVIQKKMTLYLNRKTALAKFFL